MRVNPIPYRLGPRLADWYHGWRDGRAGIPDHDTTVGRVTTPHRETLIRLALEVFELERLRYEQARGDAPEQKAAATARLDQLYAHRADAEDHLTEVSRPLSEEEKTWRRIGDMDRPERVVVQRRQTEHKRRIASARMTLDSIKAEIGHVEAEAARAAEAEERSLQAATTRVLRVHEHIHRRLNSYLRTLIRWHSHGAWVAAHLTVPPDLPGWITLEARPKVPQTAPFPPAEGPGEDGGRNDDETETPEIKLLNPGPVTSFGSEQKDPPDVRIDEPGTAPLHFTLTRVGADLLRLRDFGHGHGPYRFGQPVRSALLGPGDDFDFADRRYRVTPDCTGLEVTPLRPVKLIVSDLRAKVPGRSMDRRDLLVDMSFLAGKNTVVAVLGRSGAGKSSLLNVLIGDHLAESGSAYFNGLDLLEHSAEVADLLGFVPQDVDLHTSLTIRQLLRYSFQLRDPGSAQERERRIGAISTKLQLDGRLDQLVSTLSGGQRRRVSIAVEMLSEPALLVLDEPTSGLDPGLDRQIMGQLRLYAKTAGKTVIVTTHSTSHLYLADEVLVMGEQGRPIFFGKPGQVLDQLGVKKYADLMVKLTPPPEKNASPWSDERAGAYQLTKPVGGARAAAAEIAAQAVTLASEANQRIRRASRTIFWRQLRTLARRQVMLLRVRGRSRAAPSLKATALALLPFLIAMIGAVVAAVITPAGGLGAKPGPAAEIALSVLTTLAMLSGQALTYGDLVTDYPIIRREHRTGTGLPSVMLSKWLVFAGVATLQGLLMTIVFTLIRPGPAYASLLPSPLAELGVDLIALTIGAMSLGLLISALAKKLEQAVAFITLTSIAQIALNGVTASVPSWLNPVAVLLPDRWGLAAAASSVDLDRIAQPAPQPADALWGHTANQWLTDLILLAVLTLGYVVLASFVLWWRLNPRARRRLERLLLVRR